MENVIEWLIEARPEIIGGLIVAFLLWIFNILSHEFTRNRRTKLIVAVILIAGLCLLYLTANRPGAKVEKESPTISDEVAAKDEKKIPANRQEEKVLVKLPPMSDEVFVARCKFGDAREIEEALRNGANANAKDNDGWTALMQAAVHGHTETAELLLKHGADVNAKRNDGSTALMQAAVNGHG